MTEGTAVGEEPRWLLGVVVAEIHAAALGEYGGLAGIRDPAQFDANLNRPKQHWSVGRESRIPALAAWYAVSFATTQCFYDANKRTSAACLVSFLTVNGFLLTADDAFFFDRVFALANQSVPYDQFIASEKQKDEERLAELSPEDYRLWRKEHEKFGYVSMTSERYLEWQLSNEGFVAWVISNSISSGC